MIVGICGGSGSGKTTLLKRLCSHFGDLQPSVFSMDNYYLPIEEQKLDENGIHNFDLPTALNREKLVNDLKKLVSGSTIIVKEYHFNSPPDKNVLITIYPSELIIVEGLFLFHFEEVRELLDYSVFIKVDQEVQLDRRLYRDQESRGYSREAILYQWENHVKPCYQNYLLPFEQQADFRFRNDAHADEDFQKLTQEIGTKMEAVKL
ncbi:MAG: uridine kinase [Fluviicola sp. XM-24bin1]|nr:MAG: uridine kinase [Fluviicola sp. XM-24bin1]